MTTTVEYVRPSGPDLGPVAEVHRGHDAYVSFAVLDQDGTCLEPFSIPAQHLLTHRYVAELQPILRCDSFFTLNGQKYTSRQNSGYAALHKPGHQLRRGHRNRANTQYLCACWTDIDCYKLNLEVGTVVGEVVNAEKAGRIPKVSAIVNSGGGLWLLWLVCDQRDRDKPPRAYPESLVNFWAVIQRTIHAKFAPYGADSQVATDVARLARVPVSVNSKWNESVEYRFHRDGAGNVFSYTLPELARWFDVPPPKSPPSHTPLPPPADKSPMPQDKRDLFRAAGRKGHQQRWEDELADFQLLWNLRGWFGPGHRNYATLILTKSMKGTRRFSVAEIWKATNALFADFAQPDSAPYTHKEFSATVRSVLNGRMSRRRSPKRQDIADGLDVTVEEAANLAKWPAASRFGQAHEPSDAKLTTTQLRAARQAAIWQIVSESGEVPTIPEIIRRLKVNHGIKASSTQTIWRDMQTLNIDNPRRHRKTPKSDDRPSAL